MLEHSAKHTAMSVDRAGAKTKASAPQTSDVSGMPGVRSRRPQYQQRHIETMCAGPDCTRSSSSPPSPSSSPDQGDRLVDLVTGKGNCGTRFFYENDLFYTKVELNKNPTQTKIVETVL